MKTRFIFVPTRANEPMPFSEFLGSTVERKHGKRPTALDNSQGRLGRLPRNCFGSLTLLSAVTFNRTFMNSVLLSLG